MLFRSWQGKLAAILLVTVTLAVVTLLGFCAQPGGKNESYIQSNTVLVTPTPTADDMAAALWTLGSQLQPSNSVGSYVGVPCRHGSANVEEIIVCYPWPFGEASRIAFCESTDDPLATNGTSWGLFEINWPYHQDLFENPLELFDPEVNTRVAYAIWKDQGWEPWSCKP